MNNTIVAHICTSSEEVETTGDLSWRNSQQRSFEIDSESVGTATLESVPFECSKEENHVNHGRCRIVAFERN